MTPLYEKWFKETPLTVEEEEVINYDRYMRRGTLFSVGCQGDLLYQNESKKKVANKYFTEKLKKVEN